MDEANFKYFCVTCDKVPPLHDNENVIKITHNPVQHSKMKHIEIHHHFVREHVARSWRYCALLSKALEATDIFTKPLDESRFRELRHELNVIDSDNMK